MYRLFLREGRGHFQGNLNLKSSPSYKTDLDFWGFFSGKKHLKAEILWTGLNILVHFRKHGFIVG